MEDYVFKYIHKLPQFVSTLISRKNCSIDLKLKDFENSHFLSSIYMKSLRENRKTNF